VLTTSALPIRHDMSLAPGASDPSYCSAAARLPGVRVAGLHSDTDRHRSTVLTERIPPLFLSPSAMTTGVSRTSDHDVGPGEEGTVAWRGVTIYRLQSSWNVNTAVGGGGITERPL